MQKHILSISPSSTLMRCLKNISNWPDQGGQRRDKSLNYPQHKCNFPGKFENSKITQICLKFSISTSLLSALMAYVKNISNWPVSGSQIMNMSQNYSI